ncbi:hypothetical protein [Luteibacter sp. SG786]|uniref:hypothetical protein n=1 Tax=Luteibacter sp. SG786 TaxID=2587130 RepID=UPI001423743E|nr:hypothetical protein [Luteibacter sp. SG786]NII54392.1 hypothetical protein [Luteibacter sp. SG786]
MLPDQTETTETVVTETPVAETAPVEVTTTETPKVETAVDIDAEAIAAFDKGITESVEAPKPVEAKTAADVAAAAAAEKTADPKAAAPSAAGGAPLTVDHAKKEGDAKTPAADPETDAAVTELGLKGKAEARFREMAGTIKTQAQELEPLRQEAARAQQWEEMVLGTKSTPEQFGNALSYLAAINSGEPTAMNQAFDFLLGELQLLGKNLGREVPGLVDPLADHPDLAQEVQFGEMTRARALELAQARTTTTRVAERDTRSAAEQKQQKEYDDGMEAVKGLSEKLKAEDPDFMRKLEIVAPVLDTIRQTTPPSQWVAKITDVYNRIVLPPVVAAAAPTPAARAPISAMPLRATGAGQTMQKSIKDLSDIEAFDAGLASVSR